MSEAVKPVGPELETTEAVAERRPASQGKAKDLPAIQLYLEQLDLDDTNTLRVGGWVIGLSDIITVQVFAGDRKIASVDPGQARSDVGAAFPQYPNSQNAGFFKAVALEANFAGQLRWLKIEALARNGARHGLFMPLRRTVAMPPAPAPGQPQATSPASPPQILCHCDQANLSPTGRLFIAGWAIAQAGVKRIEIRIDGQTVGETKADILRPDVGRLYPQVPSSRRAGFEFRGEAPEAKEGSVAVLRVEDEAGKCIDHAIDLLLQDIGEEALGEDGDASIRFAIDDLEIANGMARRVLRGGFNLVGWAVAREQVAEIEVEIDGAKIGKPYYGMRREDIATAFPDWPNALLSGFALAIPSKLLRNGTSTFRVVVRDKRGDSSQIEFKAEIDKEEATAGPHLLRRKIFFAEIRSAMNVLGAARYQPRFQLVMRPDHKAGAAERIQTTLTSLANQAYDDWEVSLVLPGSEDQVTFEEMLRAHLRPEHLRRITILPNAMGVQAHPLPEGTPTLVGIIGAGDQFACDALLAVALANADAERADFLYGDDRRYSANDGSFAAFFKPDWSPDLLLAQNYIGRAWFVSTELLTQTGIDTAALRLENEYDLVLRLTERASVIRHLPKVICETLPASRNSAAKDKRALKGALHRRRVQAEVLPGCLPGIYRIQRKIVRPGRVSIIMPSIGARDHIKTSIPSIRDRTTFRDFEIIVLDNIRGKKFTPEQVAWKAWFRENADKVIHVNEPFNWSRLNNIGAAHATGEYLLFLNDDIEVLDPDWLQALMEHAQRPEVGVVGPQLLYPDHKVQHAGLFLSRKALGTARHAFRFAAEDDPGYFGLALTQRNMIGVTGACMMVHRSAYDAVDGFDEAHSVVNNDVDFCLRMHRAGRLIVYTPHTRLIHHELASRATMKDVYDTSRFLDDWGDLCSAGDPFYNPNLTSDYDDYTLEDEPVREVHAGYPIGDKAKVQRILAVKLDHIGDMVTALPAIRRLKQHFPEAKLTALVGRSAVSIASLEPAIDEVLDFEFFEARSGLGYKKLTKEDYAALRMRLEAKHFDIAVDLRKLGDTRHILQYSGAPILAGIDTDGAFPWLDYADEWEKDPLYVNKRNHVAADLLNLVDGLANAFVSDRRTILAGPESGLPPLSVDFANNFADLLASDYVCIHPASGTPMRQWPPEYFARLVDLLVSQGGVNVAIIGGPDERGIADEVLAKVKSQRGVYDLVGKSRLSELPMILARSVLFVGNNSGPHHIASGLGVPTVGVHSGVIASEEWGPLGENSLAVRRDVGCAPCYRGKVEDCHRSLACVWTISPHRVYEVASRLLLLRNRDRMAQTEIARSVSAAKADEPNAVQM